MLNQLCQNTWYKTRLGIVSSERVLISQVMFFDLFLDFPWTLDLCVYFRKEYPLRLIRLQSPKNYAWINPKLMISFRKDKSSFYCFIDLTYIHRDDKFAEVYIPSDTLTISVIR